MPFSDYDTWGDVNEGVSIPFAIDPYGGSVRGMALRLIAQHPHVISLLSPEARRTVALGLAPDGPSLVASHALGLLYDALDNQNMTGSLALSDAGLIPPYRLAGQQPPSVPSPAPLPQAPPSFFGPRTQTLGRLPRIIGVLRERDPAATWPPAQSPVRPQHQTSGRSFTGEPTRPRPEPPKRNVY